MFSPKEDLPIGSSNTKQIFFNDWVNTKSLNEVLLGDQAVTLKNGVDAIKRAKAQNAATVSAYSAIVAPELGINHTNESQEKKLLLKKYLVVTDMQTTDQW